ncbi:MAG TPA: beta-propeller fold lactonase family protein, partial [Terriglobales bacterium]|nr:beta-propeller fold lactonase family protein [Terriglobales bacterium]
LMSGGGFVTNLSPPETLFFSKSLINAIRGPCLFGMDLESQSKISKEQLMRIGYSLALCALALSLISPIHSHAQNSQAGGAVFVMNNAADKNEILSFQRAADGTLQAAGKFATGGRGSGGNNDPLGSQGSLTLSQDRAFLFAVNAGSGELSVFRVHGASLALTQRIPTGGSEPVAVAQHGDLVYVLNAGGSSEVVGFAFFYGRLIRIPGSLRFLSTNASGAASLAVSPDGAFLAVTEKATNSIDVFQIHANGTLSSIVVNQSSDPGVFAVTFAPNGALLVAETGSTGVANGSTVASYAVLAGGSLFPISTGVPTFGNANCWNAATPDGRFVYNSNAGSANIAGFAIDANGALSPLPGTVVGSNPAGATNLDIAVSADSKFVYTLNSGNGSIGIFAIQPDGTLNNLGAAGSFAPTTGFNGIAVN